MNLIVKALGDGDREERARRRHFQDLTQDEQRRAIRELAAQGLGDYELAAATKLSVEMVRRIVGERRRG